MELSLSMLFPLQGECQVLIQLKQWLIALWKCRVCDKRQRDQGLKREIAKDVNLLTEYG